MSLSVVQVCPVSVVKALSVLLTVFVDCTDEFQMTK